MDASVLLDALSASFFGLLGIWASVVRRHWFLRFAVVCVFLLSALLVPAYEVVIEFGLAIAIISVVVWFASGDRRKSVRFSLESALLAMVVVAVVSAVIAKAPEFEWSDWLRLTMIGFAVALPSLLCLWIVFGKLRLRYRLLLGLLGVLCFSGFYFLAFATQHLLLTPELSFDWVRRLWGHVTEPYILDWGTKRCLPTSLLGFSLLSFALLLARSSQWFAIAGAKQQMTVRKSAYLARFGLVTLMLSILLPLCYVLFRLLTPTPYPVVEVPADNAWDDIYAAGEMIDDNLFQYVNNTGTKTTAELKIELDKLTQPLQLVDSGLSKRQFQIPIKYRTDPQAAESASQAILNVWMALSIREAYLKRSASVPDRLDAMQQKLTLAHLFSKRVGFEEYWGVASWSENGAFRELENLVAELDSAECTELTRQLIDYDVGRATYEEQLYRDRLAKENGHWLPHVQLMLNDWSGTDTNYWRRRNHYDLGLKMRFLITQLALQAYFLDNGSLPATLQELQPEYLTTIPLDPRTDEPIEYQHLWSGYVLTATADSNSGKQYSFATGPAAPYLWQRLQETWRKLKAWSQDFSETVQSTAPH